MGNKKAQGHLRQEQALMMPVLRPRSLLYSISASNGGFAVLQDVRWRCQCLAFTNAFY